MLDYALQLARYGEIRNAQNLNAIFHEVFFFFFLVSFWCFLFLNMTRYWCAMWIAGQR